MRCATSAVGGGRLGRRTGMPASSAHAAFSAMPQAGKLNALTCTATPVPRHQTCWPQKRGRAAELDALAVDEDTCVAPSFSPSSA